MNVALTTYIHSRRLEMDEAKQKKGATVSFTRKCEYENLNISVEYIATWYFEDKNCMLFHRWVFA